MTRYPNKRVDRRYNRFVLTKLLNIFTAAPVSDGDITAEDGSTLATLLAQGAVNLTPTNLEHAVTEMVLTISLSSQP